MRHLFLASESPRRRELLEKAGVSFTVSPSKISEIPQETLSIDEQILDIARRKAMATVEILRPKVQGVFWVLAADTEVIINEKLTGKPLDAAHAKNMLRTLSNRSHEVKTGVVLVSVPEMIELSHLETTQVTFRSLTDGEIEKYVATGDPMDKAGAYGIQGEGRHFIQEFKGSVENVMGLPTEIVLKMFKELEEKQSAQLSERQSFSVLNEVKQEIEQTCLHCGRRANDVKVIAVSKLQPLDKIKNLFAQGQRCFAENYVQEAIAKQLELKSLPIEWHLIGHLQKKKLNSVLGKFSLIHSVDSLDLAQNLSKKCLVKKLTQEILLQVNVSGEDSKEGWSPSELLEQWANLEILPNLRIVGLMTMPPSTQNPEMARPYFRALRLLRDEIQKKSQNHKLTELSMGTTQDYLIAIEEGATFVRIGVRLFGERLET